MKKIKIAVRVMFPVAALPLLVYSKMAHAKNEIGQSAGNCTKTIIIRPAPAAAAFVAAEDEVGYKYPTCITIGI